MYHFKKLGEFELEPVAYLEHPDAKDFDKEDSPLGFIWNDSLWNMSDFVMTRPTPWGGSPELLKLGIDGVMGTSYFDAYGIKLMRGDDSVEFFHITWD